MKVTFRNSKLQMEKAAYSIIPSSSKQTNFKVASGTPYTSYADGYAVYLYDVTGLTSVKVSGATALVSGNGVILNKTKRSVMPPDKVWTSGTGSATWAAQFTSTTPVVSKNYAGVKIESTPEEEYEIEPTFDTLMVMVFMDYGVPVVKGK